MLLSIVFKNLKRNKKRSFLTILIILIATSGMTFGLSWIEGEKNLFLESGKRMTGDVRITAPDSELRSRSLDVSSNFSYSKIKKVVERIPQKNIDVGRIKFGGLIYFNEKHESAMGSGIENKDEKIIGFDKFIYSGRFLENNNEIIVGESLRRKLNLKLGDKVTLLTQTQGKSLYSLNYDIVGFYKMDNTRLNKSFYITLVSSQYLLDMEDRITEYLIYSNNNENLIKNFLTQNTDKTVLVKRWDEIGMNQSFTQILPFIRGIFIFIFATLSGLSISNTMLMTVFERRHEIGLLKALGMKEGEIKKMFILEGGLMGSIGGIAGLILGGGSYEQFIRFFTFIKFNF
ncbi:FtsX-like permease family protein [Psychrilyobacter sp.]|uniref:ABC transporter permease n=1 Tax=Psychrilyobacter sp. TaxID=2586924 RepID=UPI00301A8FDC